MKARITSFKINQKSHHGGNCMLVTFKGEDGESYRTWIFDKCRNKFQWQEVINSGVGTLVGNLFVKLSYKDGRLIDADSFPEILERPVREQVQVEENKQIALKL